MDRAQGTNDLAGKILRMKDDGSVPPDNPFVGKVGYKPHIFGGPPRLASRLNPYTNELWKRRTVRTAATMNVVRAGRNYGWPIVSYGRDYNGPRFSPTLPGMEDPIVYWVPSIATSGLAFYTGDRFPGWKRNVFVGGMRAARSREADRFNASCSTTSGRDAPRTAVRELHQRVRDIRQGPDGLRTSLRKRIRLRCCASNRFNNRFARFTTTRRRSRRRRAHRGEGGREIRGTIIASPATRCGQRCCFFP